MAKRYVYRTWKADGVVRRQYVGKADSVEAQRYLRARERRKRMQEHLQFIQMIDDILDASQDDLSMLEAAALRERGYERTKDRRWKRG